MANAAVEASTAKAADVQPLLASLSHIDFDSFDGDHAARKLALSEAQKLVRRLESTRESLFDMGCFYPFVFSALKICQDLNVFEKLRQNGGKPKTTQELCGSLYSAPVKRFLRHLGAMGMLRQLDEDLWAPTRLTDDLCKPEYAAFLGMAEHFWLKLAEVEPSWMKTNNYKDPSGLANCAFMGIASRPIFEYMGSPARQAMSMHFMRGNRSTVPPWVDIVPMTELLVDAESQGPVLVDVGAGTGHDAEKLLDKFPEFAGRVIIQDRPEIIEQIRPVAHPGLTPMAHDFFATQPVKGAKIYFMHVILHLFPDDPCRAILRNLKSAFKEGYSTLLYADTIIPATGSTPWQSADDILMSDAFAAKHRSADAWKAVFESAGFRIVKIHTIPGSDESVIEAVPA